jgi:hypothetical protein
MTRVSYGKPCPSRHESSGAALGHYWSGAMYVPPILWATSASVSDEAEAFSALSRRCRREWSRPIEEAA